MPNKMMIYSLVFLLLQVSCKSDSGPDEPISPNAKTIAEITEVQLVLIEGEKQELEISVSGLTSDTGWTSPTLVPIDQSEIPSDGVYEFIMVAVPPLVTGTVQQTPISVRYVINEIPSNLLGVRIHSTNNQVETLLPKALNPVAWFEFTQSRPEQLFVIELHDADLIAHARGLLNGDVTEMPSISGKIISAPANYNPVWSYHLDPSTIQFFDFAIEVCDANMQYVEDHLSEIGGSFLPGNQWCPWSSTLTREVFPPFL